MNTSVIRRKLFEPLYYISSQSPRLKYSEHLDKTQFFTKDKLEEIQWQNLSKLWSFLWDNNEFYKKRFLDAGIRKKDLKSVNDINKLPILTKKEIRQQGLHMVSAGYYPEKLLHFKTGGSTGTALDVYITEECSELRNACARRHDKWTGWHPGECIGAAWGNPKLPKSIREKLINNFVQPFIYLDTMSVNIKSVKEFATRWKANKATLLFGHAHSLYVLAQYVETLELTDILPRGILSTSMMLLPHERKKIEEVFGHKVTDRYGCEEVSLIGSECEKHEGLHMNIEHLVVEFIKDDGCPALPGESGKIVVTDLMNYAMPFVRYQVEDIGTPLNSACTCGRGLPLMAPVTGRVADFLITKNGTKIAGVSLIENTLTKIAGIEQLQIIQNSLEHILINTVPGGKNNPQYTAELTTYFKEKFGNDTFVEVKEVPSIAQETSGKYRFSICNITDR